MFLELCRNNVNIHSLKEEIFTGSNSHEFHEFWAILRKLIPAKFLAKTNLQKLILAKNTKSPHFQIFQSYDKEEDTKAPFFMHIICLFCLKIHQNLE